MTTVSLKYLTILYTKKQKRNINHLKSNSVFECKGANKYYI